MQVDEDAGERMVDCGLDGAGAGNAGSLLESSGVQKAFRRALRERPLRESVEQLALGEGSHPA